MSDAAIVKPDLVKPTLIRATTTTCHVHRSTYLVRWSDGKGPGGWFCRLCTPGEAERVCRDCRSPDVHTGRIRCEQHFYAAIARIAYPSVVAKMRARHVYYAPKGDGDDD